LSCMRVRVVFDYNFCLL